MFKKETGVMLTRLLFLLITTFVYSQQKIEYYNYGYDGIEKIGKVKDSTLVYSNFLAKAEIRSEVADSILKKYHKLKSGNYTVLVKFAKVFGRLELIRTNNLINVNYYYSKVEYNNGLVSIYKKPIKKVKKRVKRK